MSVVFLLGSAVGQQMAVGLGSPNTRDSMSYADGEDLSWIFRGDELRRGG